MAQVLYITQFKISSPCHLLLDLRLYPLSEELHDLIVIDFIYIYIFILYIISARYGKRNILLSSLQIFR
jgi:hypothetical protein